MLPCFSFGLAQMSLTPWGLKWEKMVSGNMNQSPPTTPNILLVLLQQLNCCRSRLSVALNSLLLKKKKTQACWPSHRSSRCWLSRQLLCPPVNVWLDSLDAPLRSVTHITCGSFWSVSDEQQRVEGDPALRPSQTRVCCPAAALFVLKSSHWIVCSTRKLRF